MKYEVQLPESSLVYLKDFEKTFNEKVQSLANEQRFIHLHIGVSMRVAKPTLNDNVYALVSNSKFSVSGTMDFRAEISMFLEDYRDKIAEILNDEALLIVQLSFQEREVKADAPSQEEKEEPSPFVAKDPLYTLDQMILPDELLAEMQSAINAVKYQKLIYEDWGFVEVDPVPKCVLNFYGPPGTGKTMAAHALAASIGKKIMEANYGDIESKFVGDAPKNMKKVFARAKEEDCVLFFDEADSVMGKRMGNASNGAEQAINSLRSETLKHLEQYSGVVIMATNLVTTYDPAFKSRILKSLKFELPNKEARIDMIKKKIPSKMPIEVPLSDDQFAELSDISEGMSGREIKNCFIDMAQRKANDCGESAVFTFDDFKTAFSRQRDMMEKLRKEESKEKEGKILNALKKKTPDEAKGRIQAMLEDLTPEERKDVMDHVNEKLEEVDRMRAEELKKQEQSNDVINEGEKEL